MVISRSVVLVCETQQKTHGYRVKHQAKLAISTRSNVTKVHMKRNTEPKKRDKTPANSKKTNQPEETSKNNAQTAPQWVKTHMKGDATTNEGGVKHQETSKINAQTAPQ